MKDDVSTTRKFTVAAENIKEYQFCTTLSKGQRNGAPKYQTILLVYNELIEQPYLLKRIGNNDDCCRKNDAFEREGKLWFLVPDNFDQMKVAKTLKITANNMTVNNSKSNAGKGWVITTKFEQIF